MMWPESHSYGAAEPASNRDFLTLGPVVFPRHPDVQQGGSGDRKWLWASLFCFVFSFALFSVREI